MNKREIKVIILILGLIFFQSSIYFVTKLIQGTPNIIGTNLDNGMPYISWFVYFYIIWYPMLLIIPYIIYKNEKEEFYKYVYTYIISVAICGIIFIAYPTTINRPIIENTNLSNKLVNLIYTMDTPIVNCLPSIHCLIAYLFMFGIRKVKIANIYKTLIYVLSGCIILSTLFIKQHVIYDAIASLIIVSTVWTIVYKGGLSNYIFKNNISFANRKHNANDVRADESVHPNNKQT